MKPVSQTSFSNNSKLTEKSVGSICRIDHKQLEGKLEGELVGKPSRTEQAAVLGFLIQSIHLNKEASFYMQVHATLQPLQRSRYEIRSSTKAQSESEPLSQLTIARLNVLTFPETKESVALRALDFAISLAISK
jgi:hypothetical protein